MNTVPRFTEAQIREAEHIGRGVLSTTIHGPFWQYKELMRFENGDELEHGIIAAPEEYYDDQAREELEQHMHDEMYAACRASPHAGEWAPLHERIWWRLASIDLDFDSGQGRR